MRVCIVGGGNIGTAMGSYIKSAGDNELTFRVSEPERWSKSIIYQDKESGRQNRFDIDNITSDPKEAYDGADMVIITYPSFMIEKAIKEIEPYSREGMMVGVVPGSGGCEFYSKDLIEDGVIFFGLDRVPCVSRLETYGRKVVASKKERTRAAAIPNKETQHVCDVLADLLQMGIDPIEDYLAVTFTPSNPIVHTTRLFSMFHDCTKDTLFDSQIYFYAEWDDLSSETLLNCDDELHMICDALDRLNLKGVIPLKQHYEVDSPEGLTRKMRSITSMSAILSPLVEADGKYKIDLGSRYFLEDFPYGLCIIKGFAVIAGVDTPNIDKVLKWFEKLGDKEYFVGGEYTGKDLAESAIPQNFGIKTKEDVYRFYK